MEIGIIRKIDALGRVVIPKEMREFFHIETDEELEILATEAGILIRISEYEVIRRKTREE